MSLTRRRFLTITSAACLASPLDARASWSGHAFGAEARIELGAGAGAQALSAALDTIRRMEALFSLYDPNSALFRLNREGYLEMPPEFAALMDRVDQAHRSTGGLFDPTIQPIWRAYAMGKAAPDIGAGWDAVKRVGQRLDLQGGMALTLNGIAQGFATDKVKAVLMAHGLTDILVNVGEYAIGDVPKTIGIATASGQLMTHLSLQNSAVATSSPDALRFKNGRSHIIAPVTSQTPLVWSTISVKAKTATMGSTGHKTQPRLECVQTDKPKPSLPILWCLP